MNNTYLLHAAALVLAAVGLSGPSPAQSTPPVIPLWPKGAPRFESRKDEPEVAKDWWVRNIHNPSITAFLPPKGKATGAAVIIAPGGGFRELVFNPEGKQPAEYLRGLGVAAFALKYRLPKGGRLALYRRPRAGGRLPSGAAGAQPSCRMGAGPPARRYAGFLGGW